jgi:hypothetical protein
MPPQPSGLSADTIALIGAVTLAGGAAVSYAIYRATRGEPPSAATNKVQAHQTVRETPISLKQQRLSDDKSHPSFAPDANATPQSDSHPSLDIRKATPLWQNEETFGGPPEEIRDHREVGNHDNFHIDEFSEEARDEALDDLDENEDAVISPLLKLPPEIRLYMINNHLPDDSSTSTCNSALSSKPRVISRWFVSHS